MSLYVLDTDILTLYRRGNPQVCRTVDARPPDELAIAVMSIEEQLAGWFAYLRKAKLPPQAARGYQELADAVQFLSLWQVLAYPESTIACYERLAALKPNVGKMDLRIAAITLENGGVLVTRNLRDFRRVPNLVIEDWSV
jgi:tRNA(fMet)-specific endonuclease VapC